MTTTDAAAVTGINTDRTEALRGEKLPVYTSPTAPSPSTAYIVLHGDGSVTAETHYDDSTRSDLYYGRTIRWAIPRWLTGEQIADFVQEQLPLLERVHAGHGTRWNGYQSVGTLTEDADAAYETFERACSALELQEPEYTIVEETETWLWVGRRALIEDCRQRGVEAVAAGLISQGEYHHVVFADESRVAEVLSRWLEEDAGNA